MRGVKAGVCDGELKESARFNNAERFGKCVIGLRQIQRLMTAVAKSKWSSGKGISTALATRYSIPSDFFYSASAA